MKYRLIILFLGILLSSSAQKKLVLFNQSNKTEYELGDIKKLSFKNIVPSEDLKLIFLHQSGDKSFFRIAEIATVQLTDDTIFINRVNKSKVHFLADSVRYMYVSSENITSVKKTLSVKHYKVYPNPFNQQIHVQFFSDRKEPGTLKMIGVSGKVVFEQEIELDQGQNNFKMDVPIQINNGYYIILLFTETGIYSSKLIGKAI